jgi:hypothetical protein
MERVETVVARGVPELIEAMDSGAIGVKPAAEIAALPKKQQRAAVKARTDALLCRACRVSGQPKKNCKECKAVRAAAKAEGKVEAAADSPAANGTADGRAGNGKRRNGRPAFDDRVIDDLLGKLTRAANERSKAFGPTAAFKDFWDRLEGTAKAWKRWQLEREKATA